MPGMEALVASLQSGDPSVCLQSLRKLKNSVIGNNTKKLLYARQGVIPTLVKIVSSDAAPEFVVQAAVILGSLAYGPPEVVAELVSAGTEEALLSALSHQDIKVVEAAARSLKILYKAYTPPHSALFKEQTIWMLLTLTSSTHGHVAELAAAILARCCGNPEHRDMVVRAGGLVRLLELMASSSAKTQEAALDAVAALVFGNSQLALQLAQANPGLIQQLFDMVKDDRNNIRLLAATCIANMGRLGAIPQYNNAIELTVLPAVVKLCADSDYEVRARACAVLAHLVESSESLQKAACEADAIKKLQDILLDDVQPEPLRSRLLESALLAVAALSASRDQSRKMVMEAGMLPVIVASVEHASPGVRVAACRCALSLSRSVKSQRTALVEGGIALPLLRLLNDPNLAVKCAACAVLCNIVLDFSPMKHVIIDNGGVPMLAQLALVDDAELRLHGVWALKNLTFKADREVKQMVVDNVGWSGLLQLVNDPDPHNQEQALAILRNMTSDAGGSEAIAHLCGFHDLLLPLLVARMQSHSHPEIARHASYLVANWATSNEQQKAVLMACLPLLEAVKGGMSSPDAMSRSAAIWVTINLTWPEDQGSQHRVACLRQLGFEDALLRLTEDADADVRDRARTALDQFRSRPL